jgi:type II secretory pathway component PulK
MHRKTYSRGSALILVLWCLLLLGMAIFGVIGFVELSADHAVWGEQRLDARMEALSGVAVGLQPQLQKDDPILNQKMDGGASYKVQLYSEGARLNPNYILLSGHREILVNLFTRWGMKIEQADQVVDCLYDWITPGAQRSLNGAKDADYAQADLPPRPTHRPFASFEEMKLVMGMDALVQLKPDWENSMTLWSKGPLNVQEAPAELIAAVFGLEDSRVEFFTQARNGNDGIVGTADDMPVKDVAALQSSLGIDEVRMQALTAQVVFGDDTRRVESVGQARGVQVMISVVTRLNTSPPQFLLWSEQ